MSDAGYSAKDALLVAQIGGLRAEERPDEELCQGYMELVSLRLEHGRLEAARAAVDELIALAQERPDLVIERIRAEYMGALVALEVGDAPRAIAHCEWAVARTLELELEADVPHMQFLLSRSLALAGKKQEAAHKLEEALELFETSDQPEYAALSALHLSGSLAPEKERPLLDRAIALAKASGDTRALGVSSLFRGAWHAARDEYLPARQLLERALSLLEREDDTQDEVTYALTQLTWLHVRAFALDEAEARATELLARVSGDEARAGALEARGMARQRMHQHAPARADFAASARALWACGMKSRAVTLWAGAVLNQILVWLHALRLVRSAPLKSTASERHELLAAFVCYVVLAFAWSVACFGVGSMARAFGPRLIPMSLLVIGCLPFVLLGGVVLMDIRQALLQARARASRS